jgi:hypothetical protein
VVDSLGLPQVEVRTNDPLLRAQLRGAGALVPQRVAPRVEAETASLVWTIAPPSPPY